VVLLDLGLPRLDGYEVARRMRMVPGLETAMLVAVTGHGRAEDRARAGEAGFDYFMLKPFDPDQLERLLSARAASLPAVTVG
jgi:CheY-like chemotaxis protein